MANLYLCCLMPSKNVLDIFCFVSSDLEPFFLFPNDDPQDWLQHFANLFSNGNFFPQYSQYLGFKL